MKKWIAFALLGASLGAGSLPAQAQQLYTGTLSGSAELPPNASPGRGLVSVFLDTSAHELRIDVSFSDLASDTTIAHIHCCAAPGQTAPPATTVPSLPGFPTGVRSGTFQMTFDTEDPATFNPSFLTANGGTALGAEAALENGMRDGVAYFNLHTSQYPAGELRAVLTPIPEPSTYALMGIGLLALGTFIRRRT